MDRSIEIAAARYGKDNVRVLKVERDSASNQQDVTEMTVSVLLEGNIGVSYTLADNSVVVATDSIKNTIYIKAKENSVRPVELFASVLGRHFIDTYDHLEAAHVKIVVHRWTRMTIDDKPHPHSFHRDGAHTRVVEAVVSRQDGIRLKSGINGLLVLKSTGSQFHGFIRDAYTTLPETWDRVLSTEVDCMWSWKKFSDLDTVRKDVDKFDMAFEDAQRIVMKTFAEENSPSVQNVMYKMCEFLLISVPEIDRVDCSLPNKHHFEIDLSWHKGLQNTGPNAEVYAPQSAPNGLIEVGVQRSALNS